jgi:hypothetical protein
MVDIFTDKHLIGNAGMVQPGLQGVPQSPSAMGPALQAGYKMIVGSSSFSCRLMRLQLLLVTYWWEAHGVECKLTDTGCWRAQGQR